MRERKLSHPRDLLHYSRQDAVTFLAAEAVLVPGRLLRHDLFHLEHLLPALPALAGDLGHLLGGGQPRQVLTRDHGKDFKREEDGNKENYD